jgi:GNAT superfamily N-acetyltransferase
LWRELTEWHREIYADPAIGGENPEDLFDKHLSKAGADHIWVAVGKSGVVGFVGLEVRGEEARIEPLIISRAFRRRGIGEQLVETAISEARKLGVKVLNVSPVARNAEAVRFFYKMGFRNIGHVGLFMDFQNRKWKSSLELHGRKFDF